jgi:hypothetical protein
MCGQASEIAEGAKGVCSAVNEESGRRGNGYFKASVMGAVRQKVKIFRN